MTEASPRFAGILESIGSVFDAVDSFWANLAAVDFLTLLAGLAAFVVYQSLRARASFNILRAAYPTERIGFRYVWGAYMAGYGFNSVIPARSGDVVRLFLTKTTVPNSSYPAVVSSMSVELIFDAVMAVLILTFAFSQGVFPSLPDLSEVAFLDAGVFVRNPQLTLFLVTLLLVGVLVTLGLLSARIQAFWARMRQGVSILRDRRRYLREVFGVQLLGWGFRFTAFWLLLNAFHVGGSIRNVLLVLGVNAVGALVPITPQGAGIQQALLVQVLATTAATATVAAYSVGQQVAIATTMFAIGFGSIFFLFGFRSFRDIIERGRHERDADKAAAAGR